MQIYLPQTLNLLGQLYGGEYVQNLVDNTIPKQLSDDSYYFVVKESNPYPELSPTN